MVKRQPENYFSAWKPASLRIEFSKLPPLPPISDPELRSLVFTHKTYAVEANRNLASAGLVNERSCYKVLEFQGDAALHYLVVGRLLSLHPDMITTSLSHLRELLTNNFTLSYLAVHYELTSLFRFSNSAVESGLRESQKVHADVFEAYVGALERELEWEELKKWVGEVFSEDVFPEIGAIAASRAERIASGESQGSKVNGTKREREGEGGERAAKRR